MKIEDEYKKICKKEREEKMAKGIKRFFIGLLGLWIFATCFVGTEVILREILDTSDAFGITIWATILALGLFLRYAIQDEDIFR